jgi:hypothetical protein
VILAAPVIRSASDTRGARSGDGSGAEDGQVVGREAEEGVMTGTTRKSARWSRSPMTAYLELTAFTLAGLVILVLAERVWRRRSGQFEAIARSFRKEPAALEFCNQGLARAVPRSSHTGRPFMASPDSTLRPPLLSFGSRDRWPRGQGRACDSASRATRSPTMLSGGGPSS